MTVICQYDRDTSPILVLPRNLTEEVSDENYLENFDKNFIISSAGLYTIDANLSGYCITIGQEYQVYGMLTYDNQIRYLLMDDHGIPGFFPSSLFQIQKGDVFFDWKVCSYLIESTTLLFVGPSVFCDSYDQLIDLIDRKSSAISSWLSYKDFMANYDIGL